jgi:alpha-L-fucosidase
MYLQGTREFEHHREVYGDQREFGYKDLVERFRGECFDASAWLRLFCQAGAQFVVPVAEHHDGFAMYDCSFSEWTAVKRGPRRDVVGELRQEARRQCLTFGVSYHRAEHWWYFNGGRAFPSDVSEGRFASLYGPAQPEKLPPNEEFLEDWLLRACELVDRYRPQLFWFDWWVEQPVFEPYLRAFAAYYYNRGVEWGREVAINYKYEAFPEGAAVLDLERGQLSTKSERFWQTDTAVLRNSWGYVDEPEYKPAHCLIEELVDIVSKNGAMLLNVGPAPDGSIPLGDVRVLADIGSWLRVNGEAIYGTRPWRRFGEGPTEVPSGPFHDNSMTVFSSSDLRFTVREGSTLGGHGAESALYVIVLAAPEPVGCEAELKISSLGRFAGGLPEPVRSVRLLGYDSALGFDHRLDDLLVRVPAEALEGLPEGPISLKIYSDTAV